jgi:hypothetical protein
MITLFLKGFAAFFGESSTTEEGLMLFFGESSTTEGGFAALRDSVPT